MYLRGQGVPQDYPQAFSLFQKAAAQGHTGARIKLGYMYAYGLGTSKDPAAAFIWITAASLAGDPRGRGLLSSLEPLLTPQQISVARDRASHLAFDFGKQLGAKSPAD